MALIKCPNCGEEISDKAANCVHCGQPLIKKTNDSKETQTEELQDSAEETKPESESQVKEEQIIPVPEKTKKCDKCGVDILFDDVVCPNCGSLQGLNVEDKKKSLKKTYGLIKKLARWGMVIFTIVAVIFFLRSWNVKNRYSYSEYSYHNVNAYVGGDAYNYIINGTYYTGLSVIASGFMICAMLSGGLLAYVNIKEKESEIEYND